MREACFVRRAEVLPNLFVWLSAFHVSCEKHDVARHRCLSARPPITPEPDGRVSYGCW